MVVGIQVRRARRDDRQRDLHPRRPHGEFQVAIRGRPSLVLDPAARWQARRHHQSHELHLVHSGFLDRQQRLEWILCRVLRCIAREHALPGFHRDSGAIRVLGRGSEDAGEIRRGWRCDSDWGADSTATRGACSHDARRYERTDRGRAGRGAGNCAAQLWNRRGWRDATGSSASPESGSQSGSAYRRRGRGPGHDQLRVGIRVAAAGLHFSARADS